MSAQGPRGSLTPLCLKQSPIQMSTTVLSINSNSSNTSGITLNQASCKNVKELFIYFQKKQTFYVATPHPL